MNSDKKTQGLGLGKRGRHAKITSLIWMCCSKFTSDSHLSRERPGRDWPKSSESNHYVVFLLVENNYAFRDFQVPSLSFQSKAAFWESGEISLVFFHWYRQYYNSSCWEDTCCPRQTKYFLHKSFSKAMKYHYFWCCCGACRHPHTHIQYLHIQEEEQAGTGGLRLPFSSLGQIQHWMGMWGRRGVCWRSLSPSRFI